MNKSVPASTQVEFVGITPLNPLISKCEIKVLYTGLNRNKTFISKETATKMASSLPGTPIVGEFLSEDFGDHGSEDLVIDDNGIRFIKSTVPYGFIPTDAKIWWQFFLDKDGVEREYLVTEGYLWTGRYPESTISVNRGNGQSMELDRDSLTGEWTKDDNLGCEYFNINEAYFSALCILGENVEPCFEGASVDKPQIMYSLDKDDFKSQLSSFMLDLKDALNIEGGSQMDNNLDGKEPIVPAVNPEDGEFAKKKKDEEENKKPNDGEQKDPKDGEKKDPKDGEEKNPSNDDKEKKAPPVKKDNEDNADSEEEKKKKKKKEKYNLEEVVEYIQLSKDYMKLQGEYEKVKSELDSLKPVIEQYTAEKATREAIEKEAMMAKFYMLDENEIKEIKENISNFTLDEIEAKLCVIAVRKKVNFDLDNTDNSDNTIEKNVITYNLGDTQDSTPAWLKAVEKRNKK